MCEIQLSSYLGGFECLCQLQRLKINTSMFEQLLKPLKMNRIHVFVLDVACLIFMQNVVARKHGKMIAHCFWFKNLSLDEEIQHYCHFFQL
jgi:hypothetical protein